MKWITHYYLSIHSNSNYLFMNKFFYLLCIFILIVINVLFYTKLNDFGRSVEALKIDLDTKNDLIFSYEDNIIEEQINESIQLNKEITFINVNGEICSVEQIFKENTIVFRYTSFSCEDCIRAEINTILKNKTKIKRICIIASHTNIKEFKAYYNQYLDSGMINFDFFLLTQRESLNIPLEKKNIPYYFCIDSNLRITNIFIPQKIKQKLSKSYLINASKNFLCCY